MSDIPKQVNIPLPWDQARPEISKLLSRHAAAINDRLSEGAALGNYVNDAAAAAGGIPLYGFYRNGSVVMQRVA